MTNRPGTVLVNIFAFLLVSAGLLFLILFYRRQIKFVRVEYLNQPFDIAVYDESRGWHDHRVRNSWYSVDRMCRISTPPGAHVQISLLNEGILVASGESEFVVNPEQEDIFSFNKGSGFFISNEDSRPFTASEKIDLPFYFSVFVNRTNINQGALLAGKLQAEKKLVSIEARLAMTPLSFFQAPGKAGEKSAKSQTSPSLRAAGGAPAAPDTKTADSKDEQSVSTSGYHNYYVFQGIDVAHPPGSTVLVVRGTDEDGIMVIKAFPFFIREHTYKKKWHSRWQPYIERYRKLEKKPAEQLNGQQLWQRWQQKRERILDSYAPVEENRRLYKIYKNSGSTHYWRESAFQVPLPYFSRISSIFGKVRYILSDQGSYHRGIDFATFTGTPVLASCRGRVAYAGKTMVRGKLVILDHGGGIYTSYYHLHTLQVEAGQIVQRGRKIGSVGSTGLSTGPHLHFDIMANRVHFDPKLVLGRQLSLKHLWTSLDTPGK